MLWLFMGAGKTAIVLSAFLQRRALGLSSALLVVAPPRPAKMVWEAEARKWAHTEGLLFAYLMGTPAHRAAALSLPADVFVINYELLPWLLDLLKEKYITKDGSKVRKGAVLPFDGICFDEITYLKNPTAQRSRAIKQLLKFIPWRTGLTGTPSPNGLQDLFGQFLVLDGGERLGDGIGEFKAQFFMSTGPYKIKPKPHAWDVLKRLVADIVFEANEADHLSLPPLTVNDIYVDLGPLMSQYRQLEQQFFTEVMDEKVEVFNRASLSNKLHQFCQGAVYDSAEGEVQRTLPVHDLKLDALDEILAELGDEPVFLLYQFRSDWERIKAKYPEARSLSGATPAQSDRMLQDFKARRFRLLCGHPKSAAHGIDGIQDVCWNIVWFGMTWNSEYYRQAIKRPHRSGQTHAVMMHRIMAKGTIEEGLMLPALEGKIDLEENFRREVARYREEQGL